MVYRDVNGREVSGAEFQKEVDGLFNELLAGLQVLAKNTPDEEVEGLYVGLVRASVLASNVSLERVAMVTRFEDGPLTAKQFLDLFKHEDYSVYALVRNVVFYCVADNRAVGSERDAIADGRRKALNDFHEVIEKIAKGL